MARSRLAVMPYAAGLAAVLAFSACTGADPGPPSETSAVSTGATATGTSATATSATANPSTAIDPVLAKIPAAARPETMAGAAAFAEFYFQQLSLSFEKGDPTLVDGLFVASCAICLDLRSSAAELQELNQHHVGKTLEVVLASATLFDETDRQVLVRLKQNAVPVVDATGKQVEVTRAGDGAFVADLVFDKHWTIRDLGRPA